MWYDINRFHILAFITWQFANIFAGQNLFGIYSNHVPKWKCGDSEPTKDCKVFLSCPKINLTFVNPSFQSAAMEFDWICGPSAYYQSLFTQIQFTGLLIGTFFFGSLSDRFGRKPVAILAVSNGICSTFASGLAPNVTMLFVLRFFVGLSVGGMLVVYCAWIMEVILPQQRMVVRGIFHCGWTRIILTSICFFTRDWRMATLGCALSITPALILVIFVVPESPVWLHTKGFKERMIQSEMHIARIAGVPYVPIEHKHIRPKSLVQTLKTKGMMKKLLVLWSMWLTVAICGCAMDLNSGNIAGDLYANQLCFGIFIILSKLLLLFVDTFFTNFKRRTLHHVSLIGIIICISILTIFLAKDYHGVGVLIFYLFGTAFIEFTWDACYLSAIELMETSSRASATGSCSLVARIGFVLAPTLIHANTYWPYAMNTSVLILGATSLLISYFFLTESKGVNLDDVHVDDDENIAEVEPMVQKVRE